MNSQNLSSSFTGPARLSIKQNIKCSKSDDCMPSSVLHAHLYEETVGTGRSHTVQSGH